MSSLRLHVFQHDPVEGLGCMESWANARGHVINRTLFYAGELPPANLTEDFLIVMGGPMGVHDEEKLPWLNAEKKALEKILSANKPVLGICLGAQLIADVLGAKVAPNHEKEIGWFPVEMDAAIQGSWPAAIFPKTFTPFHWHGDTFACPTGAKRLGKSEACLNQGFLYGEKVLGLQFHPEVTPEAVHALLQTFAADLGPTPSGQTGRYVQTAEEVLAGIPNAPALNVMMEKVCLALERFC